MLSAPPADERRESLMAELRGAAAFSPSRIDDIRCPYPDISLGAGIKLTKGPLHFVPLAGNTFRGMPIASVSPDTFSDVGRRAVVTQEFT